MRNTILRILYGLFLFCAVFVLLVYFSEDNGTRTTTELQEPVLPVVTMNTGSTVFNALHGVVSEQNYGTSRAVLTPLSSDRTIRLQIETDGIDLISVAVEARDLSGERLIEKLEPETEESEGIFEAEITFSNLIDADTEYLMVIILSTEEFPEIRYSTRFCWSEDASEQEEALEALAFAEAFHEATFGSEESSEYLSYLEPDDEEDNDTLACVTLYSSTELVSWGNLNPVKVTEPVYSILDRQGDTYGISGTYYISAVDEESGGDTQYLYRVEEYYELTKGTERFYLMDYSRTVSRDFDPQNIEGEDGTLDLGIAQEDLQVVQDESGDTTAFVHDGRLFAVQESGKLMIYVFGFDSPGDTGERETYAAHDIKIMNVDTDGSIDFLVYGYMNTGTHEGEIGCSFYHYSGEHRTLEEKVYIPYDGSWELLQWSLDRVCYYNAETEQLYLSLYDSLYEIDVNACSIRTAEENLFNGSTVVSDSGKLIAYEEMENGAETGNIILLNLNGLSRQVIESDAGQSASPLGFLGEDLIYGTADDSDAVQDSAGLSVEPMSHIYIVDSDLNVLEDYSREGIYITSVEVSDNQVTLQRVEETDSQENPYVSIENDEIVSSREEESTSYTQTTSTDQYENTVQILIGDAEASALRYIRPQELTYEGSRELAIRGQTQSLKFYSYDIAGLLDCSYRLQDAIEQAAQTDTGIVTGEDGQYLWKSTFAERAEIDALTEMAEGAALLPSPQACLEAVLSFEGAEADVASLLEEGMTALEILSLELEDVSSYDLTGCPLSDVLYYVGEGTPVYAMIGADSAVLIIGYGPENVELYDPEAGSVYLMSRSSAEEMFDAAGDRFLCYIR